MTRIIAGQARGRTITMPEEGTRPTSDRAREGLFSSLAVRWGFEGSYVLDLFAGSGALGLEAASRGAEEVHLVDASELAVKHMTNNAKDVGLHKVHIHQLKAGTYLDLASREHVEMEL